MMLSRRNLIQLAGATGFPASALRLYAAGDFWNTKDPDNWTKDEIAKLLKRSPWAKEMTGERTIGSSKSSSSNTNIGMPRTTRKRSPIDNRNTTTRTPPRTETYKGTVVWESAKVIRDADKTPLPEGFENQYVLSVIGIPLAKTSSRSAMGAVRQVTFLTVKGKDPLEAMTVRQNSSNGAIYYAGFSREALTIDKDDKEVVFATAMGKVHFSVKFSPKEMIYRGELAV